MLALVAGMTVQADNRSTSTGQIVAAGFDVGCLAYDVVGGCIWMTCTLVGCEFDFSVKIRHRIPEVVVTSYPTLGRSPWSTTNSYARKTGFAQDGGASDEGGSSEREQALKFKNTEVIGSPASASYAGASSTGYFCPSIANAMTPYFVSTLDYNWRDPLVETPWTLANLFRGIKVGSSFFGGLYPRIGFVNQSHDYKASLVAAKRAADIVRQGGPHVHYSLRGRGGEGYWPPGPGTDFTWQQLVPSKMSCRGLPDINDTFAANDPYRDRLNQARGNAWQLWRPYTCCERRGATLIQHF